MTRISFSIPFILFHRTRNPWARALGGLGFIIKLISVTRRLKEVIGYAIINTRMPHVNTEKYITVTVHNALKKAGISAYS